MSDERFARQYRFELPSQFPVTSPCTSIVHHLSGPSMGAPARQRGGPASLGLPCALFYRGSGNTRFPCALGFATRTLARMLDSLVRVSRRVGSIRRRRHDPGRAASARTRGAPVLGSPRPGARPAAATSEDRVWRAWWRGPSPSCLPVGARGPQGKAALIRLLPTISRTISLSFQSPFHLSLTVLVLYRSLAND